MSIKKKLPLLFCLLVFFILLANNTFHYLRSKEQLLSYNQKEIAMITKEVSFQVENTRRGSLYVEDLLARELRTASIAILKDLPPDYHDVSNEHLKLLAEKVGVSHITLLAKTNDDIIGVKSSDPVEINMSTKEWGYWYDAFIQLLALEKVTVEQGLTLDNYWSGPMEIADSNPNHIDKWGYYYDGSTNYIINPYFRDQVVLEYETRFGPGKIIEDFTKVQGLLELTVFNPKNFGKEEEVVTTNGASYIRISAKPYWYGTYHYENEKEDALFIENALKTKESQTYIKELNGKNVMKTFVPIIQKNQEQYVIGLVYNYGLIQKQLNDELREHVLLSIAIMMVVLLVSFIFSRSITQPIGYIVEQVNEIAQGNFGKTLQLKRKDELGLLTENVNALSNHLRTYLDDLQKSKELIEYQAYHDPLTGLLNRRFFQEKSKPFFDKAKELDEGVSVLFIDIDRFKQVNDTLGHSKGDELLKIVASRIKQSLSDDRNIVIRQGGDEFIIFLVNLGINETQAKAEKMVNELKKPYSLEENEIYLGASCGVSLYPQDTRNIENLLIYADMAMYAAKKMGGNKVIFFNEQMIQSNRERPLIESRLRKAIEDEILEVYYQPKINVQTGVIFGAEALARWKDEELGFVSPDRFIPIAEETGLIQPLWNVMMKTACRQISNWNKTFSLSLNLSVNFSAGQFQEPDTMVKQVKGILEESQLSPANFEIEITESILLNNSNEILQALHSLQNLGISISIDDFGTGYSSLSYLKTLPIDTLKIDKSFIQDIEEDLGNAEIPEAIINLARSLHLNVIAEGVEKEYQKDFLLSKNCVQMQGYLFSKPLTNIEFEHLLKEK